MEELRYFYSTDGTDAHGPATKEELDQLFHAGTIGPVSYLCREGETEWHPLNVDDFQTQVAVPPPPPPQLPPPPPPPQPQTKPKFQQASSRPAEDGVVNFVLTATSLVAVLGTSALMAFVGTKSLSDSQNLSYRLGVFVGSMIAVVILPFLISFVFPRRHRLLVRTVGIVVVASLMVIGKLSQFSSLHRIETVTKEVNDRTKSEAQKEIAAKGYYDGNTKQSDNDLQKLKDAVSQDDSEVSRLGRDILTVTEQLVAKAKASEAADKAVGNFDPATITSLDDINTRKTAISALRDTQVDMITFLQNYDAHCHEAMAKDNFNPDTENQTIAGARKGGHIDLLISLWQIKQKLSEDHLARLSFLQANWGHWSVKEGKLLFEDQATLEAYNGFVHSLHDDVKQLGDVQKQIFQ